ncbi:sialate O-acetylesterase [Lacunisphaera limnophila]|nr:sialate O-acetylesterase [Lacunisphaera limnophila]
MSSITCLLTAAPEDPKWEIAGMFGDNMVLQQNQPNPVWGRSSPGALVRIEIAGTTSETRTDTDGRWKITLPSLPAGGPHRMKIRGRNTTTFTNVMVGEVWLVSGQSNMDFRLSMATGAAADIAAADLPNIRNLRVPQVVSRTRLDRMEQTAWQMCSPGTAGGFSAVAFHFARRLHAERGVAVGIINATWSGTPAEAWTSYQSLAVLPAFSERVQSILASNEDWAAGQQASLRIDAERDAVFEKGTAGVQHGAHRADFDDQAWPVANYPLSAATMKLPDYAIVWLRKSVEVPPAAAGRDLIVNLGRCYEWDQTYFNGILVGSHRWSGVREYRVPGRLVRAGANSISIRLYSEWSAGQLGKGEDQPTLTAADGSVQLSLLGPWRYDGSFEPTLIVPRYYQREPTALFNGMISPIVGYGLRGALWYQGEGNAGRPVEYQTLLPALIQEWRWQWGQGDFPFLIVQLPSTTDYDWAELREAQAMATQLTNVGLAVTLDIGDPADLHPADKRPFGERLYRLARHVAYGEDTIWTGPMFAGLASSDSGLRITFKEVGGGLSTRDGQPIRGFELKTPAGDYVSAEASIEGASVVVRSSAIPHPTTVRYAWARNPDANLINQEGLPAAPFRAELPAQR